MDELEKVIARYTEVGMAADAGRTVLVAAKDGQPGYAEDLEGLYWMPVFSERADADAGDTRELLLLPMTEVFHLQMAADKSEGLVLDPYTDPLWIPTGMIPVLLDAGRHRM